MVRQYLSAYGPATPGHFAKWLNTSPAWATRLFDSLTHELEQVRLQGTEGWQLAAERDQAAAVAPPEVLLLPYFDSYAVAGQPRELLFPGQAGRRALTGGQAGNFPVLLLGGTVAGVWHLKRSGTRAAITVEPLAPLSARRLRALEREVDRVGAVLELTPALTVGPVTVGPHA